MSVHIDTHQDIARGHVGQAIVTATGKVLHETEGRHSAASAREEAWVWICRRVAAGELAVARGARRVRAMV